MNKAQTMMNRLKLGLGVALVTTLMGCVGYVGGGYDGEVVVPGPPDVVFFGGDYYHGHEEHDYSRRGYQSRAVAHPAPSRGHDEHR